MHVSNDYFSRLSLFLSRGHIYTYISLLAFWCTSLILLFVEEFVSFYPQLCTRVYVCSHKYRHLIPYFIAKNILCQHNVLCAACYIAFAVCGGYVCVCVCVIVALLAHQGTWRYPRSFNRAPLASPWFNSRSSICFDVSSEGTYVRTNNSTLTLYMCMCEQVWCKEVSCYGWLCSTVLYCTLLY